MPSQTTQTEASSTTQTFSLDQVRFSHHRHDEDRSLVSIAERVEQAVKPFEQDLEINPSRVLITCGIHDTNTLLASEILFRKQTGASDEFKQKLVDIIVISQIAGEYAPQIFNLLHELCSADPSMDFQTKAAAFTLIKDKTTVRTASVLAHYRGHALLGSLQTFEEANNLARLTPADRVEIIFLAIDHADRNDMLDKLTEIIANAKVEVLAEQPQSLDRNKRPEVPVGFE